MIYYKRKKQVHKIESEYAKLENKEIFEKLKNIIPEEKIKQNEPMKNHTSFKIGGPADFFIQIENVEELENVLKLAKNNNIKITVLGNGTNVLVPDKGIKGIVIKLCLNNIKIEQNIDSKQIQDNIFYKITADSGVLLSVLGYKLLSKEIAGFEELTGIPGTIGGAVLMNAGAYGKEMKDIVTEIVAIDYEGNTYKFTNEEAHFEYRNSIFSNGKYIILQAKMLLKNGNKNDIKEKIDEYAQARKEKQPLEFPSAGSTFKRGADFITAKLIDDAGLKGYSIGGAQVSEKHAGFIINKGNATFNNVIELVKYVQDTVYKKFGKNIELEVKILR